MNELCLQWLILQLSDIPLREQKQNESETMGELEEATVEIRRCRNSGGKENRTKRERRENGREERGGKILKQYDRKY